MKITRMNKKLKAQLLKIAAQNMVAVEIRGHLEPLNHDDDDFIEVPVWGIETALLQAYELGMEAAKKEALKK